jgi:hypothetical protein
MIGVVTKIVAFLAFCRRPAAQRGDYLYDKESVNVALRDVSTLVGVRVAPIDGSVSTTLHAPQVHCFCCDWFGVLFSNLFVLCCVVLFVL